MSTSPQISLHTRLITNFDSMFAIPNPNRNPSDSKYIVMIFPRVFVILLSLFYNYLEFMVIHPSQRCGSHLAASELVRSLIGAKNHLSLKRIFNVMRFRLKCSLNWLRRYLSNEGRTASGRFTNMAKVGGWAETWVA